MVIIRISGKSNGLKSHSLSTGFPQALEIMETWKITKKSSMHGKIMEFEKKKLNNHGKIMEYCEII